MENITGLEVKEDLRQSAEYGRYMEKIGWKTVRIQSKVQMFIRKLGPVGIAKIQRVKLPILWGGVENVLRQERAFVCKIEPMEPGQLPHGFKQDGWPLLGTKTLRISLSLSLSGILAGFKKDARYVLRKLQDTLRLRSGQARYKIQTNKFEVFYEIWRRSAGRKNLWIPSRKEYTALVECFGKKCFCITAGESAGALVLTHRGTAYYYYAGATREGNENNLPYLVVWEAIKEAKKRGCRIWDWEGILDERWPNKGWRGFSHFKKSFGGMEVEYPGCFSKWIWPL